MVFNSLTSFYYLCWLCWVPDLCGDTAQPPASHVCTEVRETTFKKLIRSQNYPGMVSMGLEPGGLGSNLCFSTYVLCDPGHVTGESSP